MVCNRRNCHLSDVFGLLAVSNIIIDTYYTADAASHDYAESCGVLILHIDSGILKSFFRSLKAKLGSSVDAFVLIEFVTVNFCTEVCITLIGIYRFNNVNSFFSDKSVIPTFIYAVTDSVDHTETGNYAAGINRLVHFICSCKNNIYF